MNDMHKQNLQPAHAPTHRCMFKMINTIYIIDIKARIPNIFMMFYVYHIVLEWLKVKKSPVDLQFVKYKWSIQLQILI